MPEKKEKTKLWESAGVAKKKKKDGGSLDLPLNGPQEPPQTVKLVSKATQQTRCTKLGEKKAN